MSNSYLVKFKPLDPFFFGGEKTFNFGEPKQQSRSKYYIKSEEMPSQTTILGALRYLLLDISGELKADFSLSRQAKDLIGNSSFSFTAGSENKFGIIEKVSPVFLINKDGHYLIKTPFNHQKCKNKKEDLYTPHKMKSVDKRIITSGNCSLYPADYDEKSDCMESYLELIPDRQTQSNDKNSAAAEAQPKSIIQSDLFNSKIQIGIRTHRNGGDENNDNSFFKKEYKTLSKKYCFACFISLSQEPEQIKNILQQQKQLSSIVYLGQSKSAFEVTLLEHKDDFEQTVKSSLSNTNNCGNPFYYAASDIMLPKDYYKDGFKFPFDYCIIKTKLFRNLETNYVQDKNNDNKNNYFYRLKKSQHLYRLIRAGSVFFSEQTVDFGNIANCQNIGFNKIIKIEK